MQLQPILSVYAQESVLKWETFIYNYYRQFETAAVESAST